MVNALAPVSLPGEFHGQRSLAGCSPQVAKSRTRLSDTHRMENWNLNSREQSFRINTWINKKGPAGVKNLRAGSSSMLLPSVWPLVTRPSALRAALRGAGGLVFCLPPPRLWSLFSGGSVGSWARGLCPEGLGSGVWHRRPVGGAPLVPVHLAHVMAPCTR